MVSLDSIVPSRYILARDPKLHTRIAFIAADPERLSVMTDTKVVMDYGDEAVQRWKDMVIADAREEAEDEKFAREHDEDEANEDEWPDHDDTMGGSFAPPQQRKYLADFKDW